MPLSLSEGKESLVASLSAIVLADSKVDVTAESINSVAVASGNTLPAYYSTIFASFIEKAGGVEKFFSAPGSGGGGSAPSSAPVAAAAPAAAAAKPKVEEVDALDGGMDMFGGEKGGGDY